MKRGQNRFYKRNGLVLLAPALGTTLGLGALGSLGLDALGLLVFLLGLGALGTLSLCPLGW